MVRGRHKEHWIHTSEIQAAIINNGFYRPDPQITSNQLNPFTRKPQSAPSKGGLSLADVKAATLGLPKEMQADA